jgi:hypothetical protein
MGVKRCSGGGFRRARFSAGLLCAVLWLSPSRVSALERTIEVTLRGRAVCLDSARRLTPSCEGDVDFGFETEEGKLYIVSNDDPPAAMLTDPRVRARQLQIVAWLQAENEIAIVKLYSIRNGVLHDIYYRCDRCNITAHTPGKCWCCQEEFELREDPRDEKPPDTD